MVLSCVRVCWEDPVPPMSCAGDDGRDGNDEGNGDKGGDHYLISVSRSWQLVPGSDQISIVHFAGHINFNDEVTAGLRLADGVLLCVDAVEGVMLVTDKVLKQAAAEGLAICLLLTKVPIHSRPSKHPTMSPPWLSYLTTYIIHVAMKDCMGAGCEGPTSLGSLRCSMFRTESYLPSRLLSEPAAFENSSFSCRLAYFLCFLHFCDEPTMRLTLMAGAQLL